MPTASPGSTIVQNLMEHFQTGSDDLPGFVMQADDFDFLARL